MHIKSWQWGKIFLFLGLSLVAAQGIFHELMARGQFITLEDTISEELISAREAYRKIQTRLEIFRTLMNDLNPVENRAEDEGIASKRQLKGLFFPLSEFGTRFFPNFSLALELRLANKEHSNIERRMERLDISLTGIEWQAKSRAPEEKTEKPSREAPRVAALQEIEILRQHLRKDRSEMKDLSDKLSRIKIAH
jgi:hypothetical protein